MSNGQSGKYLFTDKYSIGTDNFPYFRENVLYYPTYMIRSFGSSFSDESTTFGHNYGGPTSISWTSESHKYNWTGTNTRACAGDLSVDAVESLTLLKTKYSTCNWIDNMSGSTIYTAQSGTLLKDDEYYWTYYMTNQYYGVTAQQSFYYRCDNGGNGTTSNPGPSSNKYNTVTANPHILLNFYVPKITMYKGSDMCVFDVMSAMNQPVYYYSGLPLCNMPAKGKLIVDANVVRNFASSTDKTSTVTLAIKGSKFTNTDLSSETNCLFKKTYTAAELNTSTRVHIELSEETLEGLQYKDLWIKACASKTGDSVTLSTDNITCISEG